MRFFSLICALFVAFVAAQSQYAINTPQGGFQVTAGQSITITWAPSPGSISIYLTQGAVNTPGQGILLAPNVDGSTGTATFTVPSTIQPSSSGQYNFGIAQASSGNFVNFSASFPVSGASYSSGSATASATASLSSLSASASSRLSSLSASLSSQISSASSRASSITASASSAMSSNMSSAMSSGSSAMSSASRSASSSAAAATTSAPSANGAGAVQAGGLFAMIAGLVAVM